MVHPSSHTKISHTPYVKYSESITLCCTHPSPYVSQSRSLHLESQVGVNTHRVWGGWVGDNFALVYQPTLRASFVSVIARKPMLSYYLLVILI